MPSLRNELYKVCNFISNEWANFWFTKQMYNANDYDNLMSCLSEYEKAKKTLIKFWNRQPSAVKIPRSNQCAERAIKVKQELHETCKTDEKLKLKFILNNFKSI